MAYMLALDCDKGGVVFPVKSRRKKGEKLGKKKIAKQKITNIISQKLSVFTKYENLSRYFLCIPIVVPKKDTYDEFADKMNKQLENIKNYLRKIICNK